LPLHEIGLAVGAPGRGVERQRVHGALHFGRIGLRQRQAGGTDQQHLVDRQLGLQVIGMGLHRDAVGGREGAQVDKVLRPHQTARGA
jgi:hypothetical protein